MTRPNDPEERVPAKPVPPAQSTIDALLALVATGDWTPGQQLPSQRQLAEHLGVSRPTVREALVALETMGMVSIRPGRGIFLVSRNSEEAAPQSCESLWSAVERPSRLVQMYQFRHVVEPVVAGLAAQNATGAQIEDLKQLIALMREAFDKKDMPQLSRLNCALHQQVIEAANNPFFTKALAPTLMLLLENQQAAANVPEAMVAEHEAVVEALAAHAPGKARRAMRRHIGMAATRANIVLDLAH